MVKNQPSEKKFYSLVLVLTFVIICGCATLTHQPRGENPSETATIEPLQSEAYQGPRAMISVARVKNTSDNNYWYTPRIGDAVAAQLGVALAGSDRFIVMKRDKLNDAAPDEKTTILGNLEKGTTIPISNQEQSDLLVISAVSEFRTHDSGAKGVLEGGVLGAISRGIPKASMTLDIALVDSRTSRVLASTSIREDATDVNLGNVLGISSGGSELAGPLSRWKNTPIEKALRTVIKNAYQFILVNTPRHYYHYEI